MKHEKNPYRISTINILFNVFRILSNFPAPLFCPTKVAKAVDIIDAGDMIISIHVFAAEKAAIYTSPNTLFALWNITEPKSTTQYISAMAKPEVKTSHSKLLLTLKSDKAGMYS